MNNPTLQCSNLPKGNTSVSLKIGSVCAYLLAKVIFLTILFCKKEDKCAFLHITKFLHSRLNMEV